MKQRVGFVQHLSRTQVAQQNVTKIIYFSIIDLVMPKVGTKHELCSTNQPISFLLAPYKA
jgi:hypothetical protein